jgi:DNA-binding phage protein
MPKAVGTVSYRDSLPKALGNPADAAHYLNASLEDEDPRIFLMALRHVAEANGGIGPLAESAN